jgi:hypothetical protein
VPTHTRELRRPWGFIVPLLLACIITPAAIRMSMVQGRLGSPPGYDDVSYFVDALARVNTFYEHGMPAVLRGYAEHPPHSPFSTLMAMAAYLLLGTAEWTPYAMNGLVLLAILLGAWHLLRGVPAWQRAITLIALTPLPIVWMSVTEFRPDIMAGVCTAAGVLVALDGPLLEGGWRRWAAMGACFGAALLCKPATFPATLLFFGAAGSLAVLAAIEGGAAATTVRRGAAAGLVSLAAAALVSAPYYIFGWRDAYGYVWYNMFGPGRKLWMHKLPVAESLRYYLDGLGGRFMLGPYAYALVGMLGVGAVWGAIAARPAREGRRTVALGAVLLFALLLASVNEMKSQFLGLPFQVLLIACALLAVRAVLTRPLRRTGRPLGPAPVLLIVLAVVSVAAFRFPNPWGPAARRAEVRRLYERISRDVATRLPSGSSVLVFTFAGLINANNIQLEALRQGKDVLGKSMELATQLKDYKWFLERASLVLAAPSGTGITADQFPSGKALDRVLAELDADPRFARVAEYPVGATGKSLILFARRESTPPAARAGTPAPPPPGPPAASGGR